MKKFHKISSAVLSVCLAAALLAVPVAADDTADSIPDAQPHFLYVWAETMPKNQDDSIEYTHYDNVVNYIDGGPSMTASANAHDSYTANAEANLNGNLTVGLGGEPNDKSTITGVYATATAKDQGTAAATANVTGTITVGSENMQQKGVGINAASATPVREPSEPQNSAFPSASATANAGGDVIVSSSGEAVGILMESDSGVDGAANESLVNVKGKVEAAAGQTAIGIIIDPNLNYNQNGIIKDTSVTVNVDKDVSAGIRGAGENSRAAGIVIRDFENREWDAVTAAALANVQAAVNVGGSVNAEGGKVNTGMYLQMGEGSKADISVADDVSAAGTEADGAIIQASGNSVVNISVGNDLHGDTDGAVISVEDSSQVNLHVKNDLTGEKTGLDIISEGDKNVIDVLVENTLSGGEHTIEVVKKEDLDALKLTVWKAEVNNDGHIVAAGKGDIDETDIEAKEKEFLYIIKAEQPDAGGSLSLSREDGSSLAMSHGHSVAKQDEMVMLKVNVKNGYQVTGAFNGTERLSLYGDGNDVYYVIVPKGGGVYLTVVIEEQSEPEPEPEPEPQPEPQPQPKPQPQPAPKPQPQAAPVRLKTSRTIILKKTDTVGEASVIFYDNGDFVLKSENRKNVTGTFSIKNGVIELTKDRENVWNIDKNGTLIVVPGEDWSEYPGPADGEKGSCRFEFSSDDLTVLLKNLAENSQPLSFTDIDSRAAINIYKNGIYKVTFHEPDTREAEYGTFSFEKQDEKEEIIFTNLKGEQTALGDDDILTYVPMQSGSGQPAGEYQFRIDRTILNAYR